jgi:hypothetical protein
LASSVYRPVCVAQTTRNLVRAVIAGVAFVLFAATAQAATITLNSPILTSFPFAFPTQPANWLLIGTGSVGSGTTVSVNSGFELGAHLPLDGQVPTLGGGQGPNLSGVTQPAGSVDPAIGIGRNGDTALTSATGTFNFQTIDGDGRLGATTGRSGIYGDTGVQCSQGTSGCTAGNSNTFYNSTGTFPMPNTPLSTSNGIVAGTASTFTTLRNELATARTNIPLLASNGTVPGGTFSSDLFINLVNPGIHVLDVPAGSDWNLGNFDIVVNGPPGSFLVVRVPQGVNMLTSNSWIGIGSGGIGTNNVLFFTAQNNNNAHFNFSNTVFNGVSFWDLSTGTFGAGSDLSLSNGQGCAQFVSEQIVMNNVRLNNCGFTATVSSVPEPATMTLLTTGLAAFAVRRWRRRGA